MSPLERLNAHPMPLAETLGIEYLSASADEVVGRLVVRSALCTLRAFAHGGAIMSFADTLGGAAAFLNLGENAKGTTTINSQTQFVAAAAGGDSHRALRPFTLAAAPKCGRPGRNRRRQAHRGDDADPDDPVSSGRARWARSTKRDLHTRTAAIVRRGNCEAAPPVRPAANPISPEV